MLRGVGVVLWWLVFCFVVLVLYWCCVVLRCGYIVLWCVASWCVVLCCNVLCWVVVMLCCVVVAFAGVSFLIGFPPFFALQGVIPSCLV